MAFDPIGIEEINSHTDDKVQELTNLIFKTQASDYGNALLGNVKYNANFQWGNLDYWNRYVLCVSGLTIPVGVRMIPPVANDGLYILSTGDITISGTIDIKDKRKTFNSVPSLNSKINVGDKTYDLAKGGQSCVGGNGGNGGNYNTEYVGGTGGIAGTSIIAGNINGGGVGTYGTGATGGYKYNSTDYNYNNGSNGSSKFANKAPGSLVIICNGKVTLSTTGCIDARATNGVNAANGTKGYTDAMSYSSGVASWEYAGHGGDGAIPPSGGGCITIICKEFVCQGQILANGTKFTCPNGTDGTDTYSGDAHGNLTENNLAGGKGGKGGTFTSTAGDIKVHIIS